MHPINERLNQPGGLAERLFGLRRGAGLTGEGLAAKLGWASSKVSKIENGRQIPKPEDIRAWTAATDHPEAADELLDMLADAQTIQRRWQQQLRGGHAPTQVNLDRRTRQAAHIRAADILIIPGLLQTAEYAHSITTEIASVYGLSEAGIQETVTARMTRQEILYDRSKTFEFVVTEGALRTLVCPRQAMLGQLDRLLGLGMGNLTFGIIPFSAELSMTPLHGFLLLDDAAIVETYGREIEAGEEESATYRKIFGLLLAEAVTGDDARRLITAAATDLRSA